jgi:predicted nucleic acid-binding protein
MSVVVADTSCLIGLHKMGRLELLPALYTDIFIPPAVLDEFANALPFAKVVMPSDINLTRSLRLILGAGESEAISLALEQNCPIILDDKRARQIATGMGLSHIGTVGILVKAKQKALIPSLAQALTELEANGFYISEELRTEALRLVNK